MDLPCTEVVKRDFYHRPHVTYILENVCHSVLVFRGWCGVDKRYLPVNFDGPAMHVSGQTGFVLHTAGFVSQTACDLYFGESRSQ